MEEKTNSKISYSKNLTKFNFNTTLNIPIDANANIKNVLDVSTYVYDQKVECGNGKAIISGKIGVKVLYLDTDNMTNTLSHSQGFTEAYTDNSINTETYLNIYNSTISHNILSTEGTLKINCDISISPVAYLNLSLSNNIHKTDMLITKQSEISSNCISSFVSGKFDHLTNLETKDSVGKILCLNCYFTPEKTIPQDGYAIVEGRMTTTLLYETIGENDSVIKELRDTSAVKYDVEIDGITKENTLDLSFVVDKSCEEISTEVEDDNYVISIKNKVCVVGVALKNVAIEIIDDVYSLENDIETNVVKREFTKKAEHFTVSEIISNEITLANDEPAIDDVLANLNVSTEITNTYIKNNSIYLEGVVSSNLTYVDENKEYKHKQVEIPFIIDTKISAEVLGCVHHSISIIDSKIKVKRGTIIEFEYSIFVNLSIYEKEMHEMVDTFSVGKQLDFSRYDIQIFIAKPNETMWDLCKRIKISPDNIHKYNKDLPMIMQGGEKIVIKR